MKYPIGIQSFETLRQGSQTGTIEEWESTENNN
jgi:hypothetical protein